jgi:phosphatidylglycerol:prolipoprotein diacylglycerol transferase
MGRAGTFFELLFSRGGLSWFGGFAGGLAAGLFILRRRKLPIVRVLAAATPALAVAHAIGRVGCFLVGDDYGTPSTLPWAVAFPQGLPPTLTPVHPTQLYEVAALLPIAWLLLRWRRANRPDAFVLGWYLVLTGTARFAIEFLRTRELLFGPFAVAHVFSFAAVCVGVGFLMWRRPGSVEREVR